MMADDKRATWRRYSAEFKAQVLAECDVPGASVAKVAMVHGINDNVVHGWRKLARESGSATHARPSEIIPMTVTAAPVHGADARGIEVELRGAVTMKITWPLSAAVDFAAWMRELPKVPDGSATAKAIDYSPGDGQRSCASSTTACCPPTTIGLRLRSGRSRSGGRTGCPPDHRARARARPRS